MFLLSEQILGFTQLTSLGSILHRKKWELMVAATSEGRLRHDDGHCRTARDSADEARPKRDGALLVGGALVLEREKLGRIDHGCSCCVMHLFPSEKVTKMQTKTKV